MAERGQGLLTRWNDERGFGFVVPSDGGQHLFAHISAFPRDRRPVDGEVVTYAVARDERDRRRAVEVRYVTTAKAQRRRRAGTARALTIAALFVVGLVFLWRTDRLPGPFLLAYGFFSAVSMLWYGTDKAAARQGTRRTPEATLHIVDIVGGWPGGLVARHLFSHKTTKQPFRTAFWGTVVVNCIAVGLIVVAQPWTLLDSLNSL